jgi:hypothetical protein
MYTTLELLKIKWDWNKKIKSDYGYKFALHIYKKYTKNIQKIYKKYTKKIKLILFKNIYDIYTLFNFLFCILITMQFH